MKTENHERYMESQFELRYEQFFATGRSIPDSTPSVLYNAKPFDTDEYVQDVWVKVVEIFLKEEDMRLRGLNLVMSEGLDVYRNIQMYEVKRAEEPLGTVAKDEILRRILKPERTYGITPNADVSGAG